MVITFKKRVFFLAHLIFILYILEHLTISTGKCNCIHTNYFDTFITIFRGYFLQSFFNWTYLKKKKIVIIFQKEKNDWTDWLTSIYTFVKLLFYDFRPLSCPKAQLQQLNCIAIIALYSHLVVIQQLCGLNFTQFWPPHSAVLCIVVKVAVFYQQVMKLTRNCDF